MEWSKINLENPSRKILFCQVGLVKDNDYTFVQSNLIIKKLKSNIYFYFLPKKRHRV
jgi:hypothetical protein